MNKAILAFIGAGNMAASLIAGLIRADYPPQNIIVSAPTTQHLNRLKEQFNIQITTENSVACTQADIVIFAVKPNMVKIVANELSKHIDNKLVISIAAGVKTKHIEEWCNAKLAIVRCMPNTPALIGNSATGLFANPNVTKNQRNQVESIMRAVGITAWINSEADLDTVTALSGSGTAYFLYIMEALINGAMKLGLEEKTAKLLTLQTALGTVHLALESEESLEKLRQRVTSPNGTTERALKIFAENNLSEIFFSALAGAKKRAEELSEETLND